MQAEQRHFDVVFQNNCAFRVPFFQRSYVWEPDPELRTFVHALEYIAQTNRPYFMGSIILKKEAPTLPGAGDQYLVIDGQQRMTTIAIFLKALLLTLDENDDFRRKFLLEDDNPLEARTNPTILHGTNEDKLAFDAIIRAENRNLDTRIYTPMADAFRYFCGYLTRTNPEAEDNMPHEVSLHGLKSALRNQVMVIEITLGPEEDEQQIFDTINSAGRRLTTAELLKNYLFSSQETEQLHQQYWQPIFERNEQPEYWRTNVVSGRKPVSNVDAFFYALMLIKVYGSKLNLSEAQKKLYRHTGAGLFANYKQLVPNYFTRESFVQEINVYGELFMKICTGEEILCESIPQKNDIRRLYCFMQATQSITLIPYLLYVLKNQTNQAECARIFGFLESYILRRAIVGSSNNSYSDLFSENLIGAGVITYDQLRTNIQDRVNSDLCFPTDEQVLQALQSRDNTKLAQPILYMLETCLTEGEFLPYKSFISIPLMPKKYDNAYWPLENGMDEEERCALGTCLANWALYRSNRKTISKALSNARWSTSKLPQLYKDLQNASQTNSTIFLHSQIWNKEAIVDRAQALMKMICQAWPWDIELDTDNEVAEEAITDDANVEDNNQGISITMIDDDANLPDDVGISILEAMGKSVYRQEFMKYMRRNGETDHRLLMEMSEAISIFCARVHQNHIWERQYATCTNVNVFKSFIQDRADAWEGKFRYAKTPDYCYLFVEFLRHIAPESIQIPVTRKKAKIKLVDAINGEQVLDANEALDYVIRLIGPEKMVRKENIKLYNSYLVIDNNPVSNDYIPINGTTYSHMRATSTKDAFGTISLLMSLYRETLKKLKVQYLK